MNRTQIYFVLATGRTREPLWLRSTGPLVSPVLTSTWEAPVVPIHEGEHLLLYTDGVSEALEDDNGGAEKRFRSIIDRASDGRAPLLDTILADVRPAMAEPRRPNG